MYNNLLPIALAILGGILPALVWLIFWLREDSKHPEPKRMIFRAFIGGGLMVFFIPFIIRWFANLLPALASLGNFDRRILEDPGLSSSLHLVFTYVLPIFLGWALIEEVLKYLSTKVFIFRNKNYDEPIDAMIYLISAALGFSAIENILYLWSVLEGGEGWTMVFLTGNLRFLGASLLHIVSSATLGFIVALAFHKPRWQKILYALGGLIIATILHATFNLFIIINNSHGILKTFFVLWLAAVVLLILFEVIKKRK